MREIDLQPTATAHWHALVCEAEHAAHLTLGEDVQSYLVFLLQRFLNKPEIASRILALDYLNGQLASGQQQHDQLRDIADICLLYAGLFPRQASRRRVSISYYVDLGVAAYYQLHHAASHALGQLYAQMCQRFVPAMDVLQAIHGLGSDSPLLDPLMAVDLWENTGSQQARATVTRLSAGCLIRPEGTQPH